MFRVSASGETPRRACWSDVISLSFALRKGGLHAYWSTRRHWTPSFRLLRRPPKASRQNDALFRPTAHAFFLRRSLPFSPLSNATLSGTLVVLVAELRGPIEARQGHWNCIGKISFRIIAKTCGSTPFRPLYQYLGVPTDRSR